MAVWLAIYVAIGFAWGAGFIIYNTMPTDNLERLQRRHLKVVAPLVTGRAVIGTMLFYSLLWPLRLVAVIYQSSKGE